MDAVLPITREGKWIGNLDVFMNMMRSFKVGYPSDIVNPGFAHFSKKVKFSRNNMNSLFGIGVFNSDGEMWKFHRSMTRPFISRERISHFELFGRHTDEGKTPN
ncbi:hypothetical protein A0H81_13207 [Grifola frondosa]|uniref:Cytochrome P450 n=1 Tax=Grifola frondosa TaxID=5627 RepID=A0A1C7LRD4_GRIFR|nr:hypothetical protein A0H81_13207 [Grifola frondosa]